MSDVLEPDTTYGREAPLIKQRSSRLGLAYFSIMGVPLLGVVTIALGVHPAVFLVMFIGGFAGFFILLKTYVTEYVSVQVGVQDLHERPQKGSAPFASIPYSGIESFGVLTMQNRGLKSTSIRLKVRGVGSARYSAASKDPTEFNRIAEELTEQINQFNAVAAASNHSLPAESNPFSYSEPPKAAPVRVGLSGPEKGFKVLVNVIRAIVTVMLWFFGMIWIFKGSSTIGLLGLLLSAAFVVYYIRLKLRVRRLKRATP